MFYPFERFSQSLFFQEIPHHILTICRADDVRFWVGLPQNAVAPWWNINSHLETKNAEFQKHQHGLLCLECHKFFSFNAFTGKRRRGVLGCMSIALSICAHTHPPTSTYTLSYMYIYRHIYTCMRQCVSTEGFPRSIHKRHSSFRQKVNS